MFFLSCVCYAQRRPFKCALWSPAWKGLTSWLLFVVSTCEFVTFPLVSWVRCGTWLYRFLIFVPVLTLIHIWTKGEVLALLNQFKSSVEYFTDCSKAVLLMLIFYFFFCFVFAMALYLSVYMCLVVTRWERAGLLALVCGVLLWVCYFPIGILGQVWYLIVLIPDLCTLTYQIYIY